MPTVGLLPTVLDIQLYAGDIFACLLDFSLVVGGTPDYSGYSFAAQIKANQNDALPTVSFAIDDSDANIGEVTISLTPAQTASLILPGTGKTTGTHTWDIQRTNDSDPLDVRTMFAGNVTTYLDRTRLP